MNCVDNHVKEEYRDLLFDFTLENWAKQGVLLLNSALTVRHNQIGSHTKLWEPFISYVIQSLNNDIPGRIFVFWGSQAKQYAKFVDPNKHYILEYVHPAFAIRQGRDWNCPNFDEVNTILKNNNNEIIKW